MAEGWTRRQVLAQATIAAAVYTLDVWAAVAAVRYKVNSNAAIIETNDGVVVVDSHSKPSAARALYKEIQAVTKKPVKKIINTHFHWDHWQGNEVYAQANPSLEIIASEKMKAALLRPNSGVGGVPFIETQLKNLPGEIAKLKTDIQSAPDAETKARLENNLQQAESYMRELQNIKPAVPNRTVSQTMSLQEGGREIRLMLLGRGHTDGDLYIYMPREKVVATMNDGYPEDWARTVAELEKLDIERIVPGHGEPAPKAHLEKFRGYLTDLVAAVKKAGADGMPLDAMKTKIADDLAPKYESYMSRYPVGQYRDRVPVNVEAAYNKLVKKM